MPHFLTYQKKLPQGNKKTAAFLSWGNCVFQDYCFLLRKYTILSESLMILTKSCTKLARS